MTISREEFFSRNRKRFKPSAIVNGAIIQSLTAEEMRRLKGSLQTKDGNLNWKRVNHINELLICACLVDDSHSPLFTEEHAFGGDMAHVDGAITNALGAEIKEWVGWAQDSDISAIEAALKNSPETPTGPSSTA